MKKLLIAIVLLLLCGCDQSQQNTVTKGCPLNFAPVVVVDGCEYYELYAYGFTKTYTHKGNCKNPIHWENK